MTYDYKKFNVIIGGDKKTVVAATKQASKKAPKFDSVHHVHILDRSGSMYAYIDELINNVQKSFDVIRPEDYVSIIWFSSPNQYRTVVKGARKTDDIKKLLDSIRSVLGSTCFSDPIKEAASLVDELSPICPNFSMTLFTDGCPVVPWSIQEEESRVFKTLSTLKDKVMAINTVGYGYYYNRDFLVRISQVSQHGVMTHSREIAEYFGIFNANWERVSGLVSEPVNISSPGAMVLYLGGKGAKLAEGRLDLKSVGPGDNTFYIINDGQFSFEIDGAKVATADIPLAKNGDHEDQIEDMLYALAHECYYSGRRQEALDILAKNVRDKALVDNQINAFTYDEVAAHLKLLEAAVVDRKARFTAGKCPANYIPKADALCVMDVLGEIFRGDNFYVPYSKLVPGYERIGRKATDKHDIFKRSQDEVLAPVKDFVFNKEHLNLSLRFTVNGTVDINPGSAKRVGLPKTVDARIYRTHTLVKDGNLNVKTAEFKLDADTVKRLADRGAPVSDAGDGRYLVDFGRLPIVNRAYIDGSMDIGKVFESTVKVTRLEAAQKVVNYYFDKVIDKATQAAAAGLTPDQLQVLEDHGLDKTFTYRGVDVERPAAEDSDFVEVRTMEFYLKGFSSLPKVDEVVEKSKKNSAKLTAAASMMLEAKRDIDAKAAKAKVDLSKPSDAAKKFLDEQAKGIRAELMSERTVLNTLKLSKILTGDWFQGLTTDDKGNSIFEKAGLTMVARAARTKQYI